MNIIADEAIPSVRDCFASWGSVSTVPSTVIHQHIPHADLLLVRTVTPINASTLQHSPVKAIGSMSAGIDHLDLPWLTAQGIHTAHAPGCNARAVAEYVLSLLAYSQNTGLLSQSARHIGIVGLGHVGQAVEALLRPLGYAIIPYDPPRQRRDWRFSSALLSDLYDADVILLHTALTKNGPHPSQHMINPHFIRQLKKDTIIINAARGRVIHPTAFEIRPDIHFLTDVWAHEPQVKKIHLSKVMLGTPHIAGYTEEAKLKATHNVASQLSEALQQPLPPTLLSRLPPVSLPVNKTDNWRDILLRLYNPHDDAIALHNYMDNLQPDTEDSAFSHYRSQYPLRAEWSRFILTGELNQTTQEILSQWGFQIPTHNIDTKNDSH